MRNMNVLSNLRCPKCRSYEPLQIEITTTQMVTFFDAGGDSDVGADLEWDDDSACVCEECQHSGVIHDFTVGKGRRKRYYFAELKELNRGLEYIHKFRFKSSGKPEVFIQRIAARFYDAKGKKNGDGFSHNGGSIFVKTHSCREISSRQFADLAKILTDLSATGS